MAFPSGTRLGRYRLESLAGAGGLGEVYRAHDSVLGRTIALKILPAELTRDEQRVKRFVQEAKAASALTHPHIVTIHDIGEASIEDQPEVEAVHYISMELIDGETLRAKLAQKIDLAKKLGWLTQVAEGLGKAHEAGIVHRDLKPENIMISRDGYAKILDFGLAKLVEPKRMPGGDASDASTLTRVRTEEGKILGTVGYMSPEQVEGKPVDHRSDIFSFGCILYEAITGERAFKGSSQVDVLHKIVHEEPRAISDSSSVVPPEMQRIAGKTLRKDASERYQSTLDLLVDLREVARERQSGGSGDKVEPIGGKRRLLPGIAVGLLALIVVSLFVWDRARSKRETEPRIEAPGRAPATKVSQVTFDGNVASAAISPDGRSVAFVTKQEKGMALAVQDLDGGTIEIWHGDRLGSPIWMPDGAHVLIEAIDDLVSKTGLWMIPRLGGSPRRLDDFKKGPIDSYAVSPDGSRVALAFPTGSPERGFTVSAIGGGGERRIELSTFRWLHQLWWSPRGNRIALVATDMDGVVSVWTISPDGKDLKHIETAGDGGMGICWAPAGDALYVAGPERELLRVPLTGGPDSRQVLLTGLYFVLPSVSRNGRALLAVGVQHSGNLWRLALEDPAAPAVAITRGTADLQYPDVAPDGKSIVVQVGDEIVRMALDGGERISVTKGWAPSISTDGARLAFLRRRDGALNVWVSDSDGRSAVEIPSGAHGTPLWLPDGRLAWQTVDNRNFRIRNLVTGEEEDLIPGAAPAWIFDPRFSADGARIAAYWNRKEGPGLWVIDWPSRQARLLAPGYIFPVGWSSDGGSVYVVGTDEHTILSVSVKYGKTTEVGAFPSSGKISADQCDVTPDGQAVVCAVRERTSDAWLVENFDPSVASNN